jgi:hypothetical protein
VPARQQQVRSTPLRFSLLEQLFITCRSRSFFSGLFGGRVVGVFDEFAVLESGAGAYERNQVRGVHGASA